MPDRKITIGLMSGTSLDGVDAVAMSFQPNRMTELGHAFVAMPEKLRVHLHSLCFPGENEIDRMGIAGIALSELYAEVTLSLLQQLNLSAQDVTALGAHGQTIRHRPEKGFTTQLLQPALLAERTNIDVICDFRSRDIAAGGEGAPLVPAFHAATFTGPVPRAILNIGGISNLSLLPSQQESTSVRIFGGDTGPGNILLNHWCESHIGETFDRNGHWSRTGKLCLPLLNEMLLDPYFSQPFPKSTGREHFSEFWLQEKLSTFKALPPEDVARTLTELTAVSIIQALHREAPEIEEIFVCGGGAFNHFLLERLQSHFKGLVTTTDQLGVAPDHVEGAAFAWLAHQFIERLPGNLPSVTKAQGQRILGALYPH